MQYLKSDVRARILAAAEQEFKTNGVGASVRVISENAGISLGNIYRYFSNKDALFCAVLRPVVEEISEQLLCSFAEKQDPQYAAETVVDYLWQHPDKLAIIQQASRFYVDGFNTILTEECSNVVEKALAWYPDFTTKVKNPYFATAVMAGFLQALTFTKLSDTTPEEQKRNVKELVVFFFGGLENRFENYK